MLRPPVRAVLVFAAVLAAAVPAHALGQAGTLDTSFSGDGRALTNFTKKFDWGVGVAAYADGRTLVAGTSDAEGGRFALARYRVNGTLDTTFGNGDGKVRTDVGPDRDAALDVVLLPGEKILVVGSTGGSGGRFALVRYHPDGVIDKTFGGGDGRVFTNFSPSSDVGYDVALDANGKIVVSGAAGGLGGRFAVARYGANGALDRSFSGDGKATVNFTSGYDYADALALDGDAIVPAGTANYNSQAARFALARLEVDGPPDDTFGGDGKLTTNITSQFDGAFAVAVQPGGKIVAAGQADHRFGLVRYDANGNPDPTFNGGTVLTDFTTGVDYVDDLVLQSDGKIVVAGSADYFARNSRFALARYDADGGPDPTFGGGAGKVTTNFARERDGTFAVAIQPTDGKIVAAGFGGLQGGRFAVARYHGS